MIDREALISLIQKEIQQEQAFIEGLGPEDRSAHGTLERWAAKDLLAHINSWKLFLGENLQAYSRGEPGREPGEDDDENAATFEKFKDRTWDEVMDYVNQANDLFTSQVRALSDETLQAENIFPWEGNRPLWRVIAGTGYIHPIFHLIEHAREKGDAGTIASLNESMAEDLAALDTSPAWQGIVRYNLACHYSLTGEKKKAIDLLKSSLELNPELVEWSKQDSELDPLRAEPGYQALYGG